ncbi:GNAT family N-acetyltransferase [Lactobacillus sp. DCY120]|uniref:GNAT family N-acetyltransferase n=1 Tax=Bombilactobacillus apium TaxID=2675299 RepID=A0A850QY82_9LACO|nr:GNAT family protein [Bombilactobacillus apium]NVY96794.1 GNAT family N-acetyltransferase [Bombilactobacillus apium]
MFLAPQFELDDSVIQLVLPEPDHASDLFELIDNNRKHLQPWLTWVSQIQTIDDEQDFIKIVQQQMYKQEIFLLIICIDGLPGGVIDLHEIEPNNHRAKVGYWLAPQFQKHGIMTHTLEKIIAYGFNQLHLHRLEIWIDSLNFRAQHVPQRLGFQREAKLRDCSFYNQKYHDLEIYSHLNYTDMSQ